MVGFTGELELVIKRLDKDIHWDVETIKAWLLTPHNNFNMSSPYDMINAGFGYKVLDYIDMLKDNLTYGP